MTKSFLIFLLLILPGCGYRFGFNELSEKYHSVYIPYAEGDATGDFTAQLIHVLSTSGAYEYNPSHPDAILYVKILEYYDENIGFRYDRNQEGEIAETLVPSETRRFITVEVTLVDACRGCVILGPSRIQAYTDFDHEFNSSRDAVNVFSLGQVTEIDGAIDAAARPLNRAMAIKIVNFISNAW